MFEFDSQNNLEIFNIYQSQYSCRVHLYKKHVEGKIYGNRNKLHNVLSPLSKGENLNFLKFQKGKNLKKFGVGKPKGGRIVRKKGGQRLFNLDSGIEKDKNGDFYIQISINIFKNLLAAANNLTLWTYTYIFYKQPPSKLSARSFLTLSNFCGELDRVKQLLKYTLF